MRFNDRDRMKVRSRQSTAPNLQRSILSSSRVGRQLQKMEAVQHFEPANDAPLNLIRDEMHVDLKEAAEMRLHSSKQRANFNEGHDRCKQTSMERMARN